VTIAAIVVVIIVALLAFAATRPTDFRTARSMRMKATHDTIAPNITDFHRWVAWSPWEKIDPTMQKTYTGAPTGTGAVYEWKGNKKVGQGRMEILDASAREVRVDLQFVAPFKAHNLAIFTLDPSGDSTNVTWAMEGKRPFMLKLIGIFMNMDKLVGRDFERGLASLKGVVEK
jgi:hypothetical protein